MRSCATRLANLKGPTQTGLVAKLSPAVLSAAGDMIMPDRSASTAVSGTNGALSLRATVEASTTSTAVTLDSELRRDGELAVDFVELLAHRGEDDAPDEGPGQGGIELVGLGGQRHPEGAA